MLSLGNMLLELNRRDFCGAPEKRLGGVAIELHPLDNPNPLAFGAQLMEDAIAASLRGVALDIGVRDLFTDVLNSAKISCDHRGIWTVFWPVEYDSPAEMGEK